jgi:hypothetical protein
MDYNRLVSLSNYRKQYFGRGVFAEIYFSDEGILVLTRMHDDYHDIGLAMLVDEQTSALKSIDACFNRIPYPVCEQTRNELNSLKGMKLNEKGVLREIKKRIDRKRGCTHLFEMLEASLRALFVARNSKDVVFPPTLTREEVRQLRIDHPSLVNTCLAFNEQGRDEKILSAAKKKLKEAKR